MWDKVIFSVVSIFTFHRNFSITQPRPGSSLIPPIKLEWNLSPDNIEDVNIAIEHLDRYVC